MKNVLLAVGICLSVAAVSCENASTRCSEIKDDLALQAKKAGPDSLDRVVVEDEEDVRGHSVLRKGGDSVYKVTNILPLTATEDQAY